VDELTMAVLLPGPPGSSTGGSAAPPG
jgi:hypothetical protein